MDTIARLPGYTAPPSGCILHGSKIMQGGAIMLIFFTRTKSVQFLLFSFPYLVLVPFLVMVITLLLNVSAFTDSTLVDSERMLDLTWNPPEGGSDHYRVEITRIDLTSDPAITQVFIVYTKNNHYKIKLDEGYSYTLRIQGVNSYGLLSSFSKETTFSISDIEKTTENMLSNNEYSMIFSLSQNKPNPFNPMTTIFYSLQDDANVNLVVYNISGQKVTELQNGIIKAGNHSVIWDATEMPSGIYFYTLMTDRFNETKKMLLLK